MEVEIEPHVSHLCMCANLQSFVCSIAPVLRPTLTFYFRPALDLDPEYFTKGHIVASNVIIFNSQTLNNCLSQFMSPVLLNSNSRLLREDRQQNLLNNYSLKYYPIRQVPTNESTKRKKERGVLFIL